MATFICLTFSGRTHDCILVVIAVNDDQGEKELLAIEDRYRESKASWQTVIRSLKSRSLLQGPQCATGNGALGFWSALSEEFPETKRQRCWVHKTVNVLDKLPKNQHGKAKEMLHEIWMSADQNTAKKAMKSFVNEYELKYPNSATSSCA